MVVGLVPAAGQATRLAPLPCSKELYPLGFQRLDGAAEPRPRPVCTYLLTAMRLAGAERVYVVLRHGKWDLPAYLRDGHALGLHLAYLLMRRPFGVPYTLDAAYPFVRDERVVFGFPDIVFEPAEALRWLLAHQATTAADLVLGLFPRPPASQIDAVVTDADGQIHDIVVGASEPAAPLTWILAAWTPTFTRFLHTVVAEEGDVAAEVPLGTVLRQALQAGLRGASVVFTRGCFVDIGTPEGLVRASRWLHGRGD